MNCGCHANRFDEITQEMIDAWNKLMDMAESNETYDSMKNIYQILFDDQLRDSWHIPQKIMRNHQVLNRRPLVTHIRNHI